MSAHPELDITGAALLREALCCWTTTYYVRGKADDCVVWRIIEAIENKDRAFLEEMARETMLGHPLSKLHPEK